MQVSCTTIEEMVLQLAELDNPPHRTGASPAAIISHYDMGEEFFQLVLDPDLVYSCALFEAGDSLWDAQRRKLDHHIQASGAGPRSASSTSGADGARCSEGYPTTGVWRMLWG